MSPRTAFDKRAWQREHEKSEKRRAYLASPAGRAMRLKTERKYRESVRGQEVLRVRRLSLAERLRTYRKTAERRAVRFDLSPAEFATFWQTPCSYCGAQIATIGLDRVDNTREYSLGNVVACCTVCNFMKLDKSREFFISHCRRIVLKAMLEVA